MTCCCVEGNGHEVGAEPVAAFDRLEETSIAAVMDAAKGLREECHPDSCTAEDEMGRTSDGIDVEVEKSTEAAVEQHDEADKGAGGPSSSAWPIKLETGTVTQKEFSVTITKVPGKHLGLGLDILDQVSAVVDLVDKGPVREWNREHPDLQIKLGDRIVEVNDTRGQAREIVQRFREDMTLKMVLRRPKEVMVTFIKTKELGLQLHFSQESSALLILEVAEGHVRDWNDANKGRGVRPGDRIVEVNGIRGKAPDLMEQIRENDELELLCHCYEVAFRAASLFD